MRLFLSRVARSWKAWVGGLSVVVALIGSVLAVLYFGNPQWHRSIYDFQLNPNLIRFSEDGRAYPPAWTPWPCLLPPEEYTGHWKMWYKGAGVAVACDYVDGKPHGKYQQWRSDGDRWIEGHYDGGRKTGVWTFIDDDGRTLKGEYRNGVPGDGRFLIFERRCSRGGIWHEMTFAEGVFDEDLRDHLTKP